LFFFNIKITLLDLSFKNSKIYLLFSILKEEKENVEIPGHR